MGAEQVSDLSAFLDIAFVKIVKIINTETAHLGYFSVGHAILFDQGKCFKVLIVQFSFCHIAPYNKKGQTHSLAIYS